MNIKNKLISIISSTLVLSFLFTSCTNGIEKNVSSKDIISNSEQINNKAYKENIV